jgi:hypothetical protein
MRGDEERDELITAALRSYAEPPEVPDARTITARALAQAAEPGPRKVSVWAWGVPAMACGLTLVIAGAVWVIRGPRTPEIAWTPRTPGVTQGIGAGEGAVEFHPAEIRPDRAPAVRIARATPGEERLPKLDVFPTPQPLSPEERAILAFEDQAPLGMKKNVLEEHEHLGDPITIAEMKIQPLDEEEQVTPNK